MPRPLVDLRQVGIAYLEPALRDEIREWRADLDWDFSPSANLVRRFVGMRALGGYALPAQDHAAGYAYQVIDEGKGLIGGLYLRQSYRHVENEDALVTAVLGSILGSPARRVEAQLLMLSDPLERRLPYERWVHRYARRFLKADLAAVPGLESPRKYWGPSHQNRATIQIQPWTESLQAESAEVIAAAYRGHVDSEINDQYQSVVGARRFLANIVQYPGCGIFFRPGAFAAIGANGRVGGVCLSSLVAPRVGHITQVCVAPELRGKGLGRALLSHSLAALAEHGCTHASLTVTEENRSALGLYERLGFRTMREFAAYVWEID